MFFLKKFNNKKRPQSKKQTELMGFSIIELAIVLTIFSFFAVNAIITQDTTKDFVKYYHTTKKLDSIKDALNKYVETFGHYPCPADGTLIITSNDTGTAGDTPNSATLTMGVPNCENANFKFDIIDKAMDTTLPGSSTLMNFYTGILTGTVPTQELGLPNDYIIDSFGNRITYVVRKELTSTLTFAMSTNTGDEQPHIDANPSNAVYSPSGTTGAEKTLEIRSDIQDHTVNAAFALISHGPNGYGAFPFEQGLPGQTGGVSVTPTTRIAPPDIDTNCDSVNGTGGTFSSGELRNHHLCREANPSGYSLPACTTAPCKGIVDNQLFAPYMPEVSPGNSAILYDDIVVWDVQRTHDLEAAKDSQDAYPMIPYYEGGDDGSSPDQFPGLALWLDAQDCETIIDKATDDNVCDSTGNKDVSSWAEKISIFNNFYTEDMFATGGGQVITGNKGIGIAPEPIYGFSTADINNNPAIYFPGNKNAFILEGPNIKVTGPVGKDDPNLRPESITVFVVGTMLPASLGGTNAQVMFSRTNLAVATGLSATEGYAIMALDTGFGANKIGFAINDFYDGVNLTPKVGTFAAIDNTNADPHIYVGMFDDDNDEISFRRECNTVATETYTSPLNNAPEETSGGSTGTTIGKLTSLLNNSLAGNIGEIIVYNRALSDWEREEVTRYLAKKWGFTVTCSESQPDVSALCPAVTDKFTLGTDIGSGNPTTQCCSTKAWGASAALKCCMDAEDVHVEKCESNSDCCGRYACSAFGFCYDPLEQSTGTAWP